MNSLPGFKYFETVIDKEGEVIESELTKEEFMKGNKKGKILNDGIKNEETIKLKFRSYIEKLRKIDEAQQSKTNF
jgi:hypothetical protein